MWMCTAIIVVTDWGLIMAFKWAMIFRKILFHHPTFFKGYWPVGKVVNKTREHYDRVLGY